MTVYAHYAPYVTIHYQTESAAKGTVSRAGDGPLAPLSGTALGSTAQPKEGYSFVEWRNGANARVSTSAAFVPGRNADGLHFAGTYTAYFAANTNTPYTVTWYDAADDSVLV